MKKTIIFALTILIFSALGFANEENNVRKTFNLLKQGYERKDVNLLSRCFIKLPDRQRQAYEDIFKVTRNYSVSINVTNIRFNDDKTVARADTTLAFEYEVFIGDISEPQSREKIVSYLLYKKGTRWCILGTHEPIPDDEMVTVTDKNYEEINELLKQLPVDVREKLFEQDHVPLTVQNSTMQWETVPGAAFYVVSITSDDITQVEETEMVWKVERYQINIIDIPQEVLSAMTPETMYYFNIFAYTENEETISGQIIRIQFHNE